MQLWFFFPSLSSEHNDFVNGFWGFWKKSLMLTNVHLFDQKYNKNSNIVKYYFNLK